jgi:hypothetical protein
MAVLQSVREWFTSAPKLVFAKPSRYILFAIAVGTWCVAVPATFADSCKPDASTQDRITKQRIDEWAQVVSSSGFLSAALMDNDVTFTAFVKRVGDHSFILIRVEKIEESMARAAFESHYHGSKGDQLVFGFKDGEPAVLVVTEVANQAQADMFGKLHMSVVWAANVSANELVTMRNSLTTKQIDAIRITQAAGNIEEPVSDKNGRRLMEKFGCFYQTLDKLGVDLATAPAPQIPVGRPGAAANAGNAVSIQGHYLRKGKPADFADLSHGMYSIMQDGHSLEGTYEVQGDTVSLAIPRMKAHATARIVGNTLVDNEGIIWEKRPDLASASEASAPPQNYSASAPGKYVKKGKSGDFLELVPAGAFSLTQDGSRVDGTYEVVSDNLMLTTSSWPSRPGVMGRAKARFAGNTIAFSDGNVYEKQAELQKTLSPLTIDQVIQMVAAKLPDDIIISTIRSSGSKFDLSPEALIKLKTAGVSDAVIRVMTR